MMCSHYKTSACQWICNRVNECLPMKKSAFFNGLSTLRLLSRALHYYILQWMVTLFFCFLNALILIEFYNFWVLMLLNVFFRSVTVRRIMSIHTKRDATHWLKNVWLPHLFGTCNCCQWKLRHTDLMQYTNQQLASQLVWYQDFTYNSQKHVFYVLIEGKNQLNRIYSVKMVLADKGSEANRKYAVLVCCCCCYNTKNQVRVVVDASKVSASHTESQLFVAVAVFVLRAIKDTFEKTCNQSI